MIKKYRTNTKITLKINMINPDQNISLYSHVKSKYLDLNKDELLDQKHKNKLNTALSFLSKHEKANKKTTLSN